jgi:hypothetical protein
MRSYDIPLKRFEKLDELTISQFIYIYGYSKQLSIDSKQFDLAVEIMQKPMVDDPIRSKTMFDYSKEFKDRIIKLRQTFLDALKVEEK